MAHRPVMLDEAVETLAPAHGDVIIDATFGGGGYAAAILETADCCLLAIDRDLDAITRAEAMARDMPGLTPILGRFGDMDTLARAAGHETVQAVVMDLGVSSFHLDEAERGFSFRQDGPLDMRMGQGGPSAADAVNQLGEGDLADIIHRLGEERGARRIARAIVARRREAVFETTLDLANCVEDALGGRQGAKTHPATRTFQAIRMFINDELGELARALGAAERLLAAGGRLVIVTFHSLEDRLVKTTLNTRSGRIAGGSRHLPQMARGPAPSFEALTTRARAPGPDEVKANPRARSARMRAARRTSAPAWDSIPETGVSLPGLDRLEWHG